MTTKSTQKGNIRTLRLQKEKAELAMQIAYMRRIEDMFQSLPAFARDADEGEWKALGTGKRVYTEADIDEMQETAIKLYYTERA